MDIDPNNNNSYSSAFPLPGGYYNNNYNGGNASTLVPQQLSVTTTGNEVRNNNEPVFGLIIPGCPIRTDFRPMIDTPGTPPTKYSLNLSCTGDLNNVQLLSITDLVLFVANNVNGRGLDANLTTATVSTPMNQQQSLSPIPPDFGVLCYWQISHQTQPSNVPTPIESTGFALFGALTSSQLSAVYRTGWSEHEQLVNMVQSSTDLVLTIGLSIEPIQNVQNLLGSLPSTVISLPTTVNDIGGMINTSTNTNTTNHRLYVAQKIALDLFHFMKSFDTNGGGSGGMMTVPNNIFDRWYQRFENRYRRDPNFFLKSNE